MHNIHILILSTLILLACPINSVALPVQETTSIQIDISTNEGLLEYGDVEDYLNYEFEEYDEPKVIEYIEALNSKMENCSVEFKKKYSNDKYLIFEMNEIQSTECEQMYALAWEIGSRKGGFILEAFIVTIDGFVYNDVLVLDYGTCGDRGKLLYDLDKKRGNMYLGSLSVTSQPVSIRNTPWLLYQSVPLDYDCNVGIEPQSEIHMYNIYSKMTVVVRKAFGNTMWLLEDNVENDVFSIVRCTQDADNNIGNEIVGEINYDNQEYRSILENKIPLKNAKQYFKCVNTGSDQLYCNLEYRIESDFLCVYNSLSYHGIGQILDEWNESDFPKTTTSVVKVKSENKEVYIYAYIDGEDIVLCKRLLTDDKTVNEVITIFEGE